MTKIRFRVLSSKSERRQYPTIPQTIPWSLIEPHEQQALKNHNQSLECLDSRGGLGILELYVVLQDLPYKMIWGREITKHQAIEFLLTELYDMDPPR